MNTETERDRAEFEQKFPPPSRVVWNDYRGYYASDYDEPRTNAMADKWTDMLRAWQAARDQQAEAWKPSGTDYDMSIHHNPDHYAWADLFMETFPNCGADKETMAGWFANAMMAKHDSMPQQAEAEPVSRCPTCQGWTDEYGDPVTPTPAPVVPEGWQLVPKEPTIEMIDEAMKRGATFGVHARWRAMLSAAPSPDGQEGG